jgi:hypothetical protein
VCVLERGGAVCEAAAVVHWMSFLGYAIPVSADPTLIYTGQVILIWVVL